MGVGYYFTQQLYGSGGVSVGSRHVYTQYKDSRFSGGHYHVISSEGVLSLETSISYRILDNVKIGLNYNTIGGLGFAAEFGFKTHFGEK
ncbi:hypothetical protein EB093_01930 [bacterium]|nr:hypothetical protein [bacterium]